MSKVGFDSARQKGHSDVKWRWKVGAGAGWAGYKALKFKDGYKFPWDPPEPLPLEWKKRFRGFSVKFGHYCAFIDVGKNWKWESTTCQRSLPKATAFCKIPRGNFSLKPVLTLTQFLKCLNGIYH